MRLRVLIAGLLLAGAAAAQSSFQPGSASNITQLAADPSPCNDAQIWYNFTTNQYKICPGGTASVIGTGTGSGTVTSVTFTGDGIFDSSTPSSAVTSSGTLTAAAIQQAANCVFAGPSSGAAANPSCRALVALDIPTLTPAQVGLSNVTNDTQTKAAIVPNTAPAAGQILAGNAGGTAYAPVTMAGDCTLASTGSITCTKTSGTALGTFATQNFATPPAIGGTTPAAGNFSTLGATGLITTVVGTATNPSVQATGSASNTGILLTTTAGCWDAAGSIVACSVAGGYEVADGKAFAFSQTSSANGTAGANLTIVGTGTTENITPSSPMLMPQCKPTSAITLTTQTTICSWTLPNAAATWSWHCMGTYSTTSTSISFTLGMVAAQAPTSETGNAIIYTGLAGTSTAGSATATSTTATTILAGGSIASATASVPWQSSGTIQASATSGTFILYGTASTSSDVTVNVGTSCQIF